MFSVNILAFFIILLGIIFSVAYKKLTLIAAITGGIIASLIFLSSGFTGITMMAVFFILGSAATSWQLKTKQQQGLAEENKGTRTTVQVIANAGVAALLSICALIYPSDETIINITIAATFASATADTLSSELGNVYGRKFFNIITFKKDQKGLNGVISLEGTLFGIAGSIVIATIYIIGFQQTIRELLFIIIAGTVGNVADSIIGATLERKGLLKNDAVNFINTLIAALSMLLLQSI